MECTKIPEPDLHAAFDRYDADKSGFIEACELRKAVSELLSGQKASASDIDAVTDSVMKEVDTNGDQKISFEEFKKGFASRGK